MDNDKMSEWGHFRALFLFEMWHLLKNDIIYACVPQFENTVFACCVPSFYCSGYEQLYPVKSFPFYLNMCYGNQLRSYNNLYSPNEMSLVVTVWIIHPKYILNWDLTKYST